jgi:hypothetical protein
MKYIARWRAMIAAAPLWIILSAVPAKAALYLYEINARIVGEPYSIAGSFTMDSSIGPTSVSNINIQATGLAVSGPFTFSFNGVYEPNLTWPNAGYLWFANDA